MAGGIQEGNGLAVDLHLIGADVLGDAAGFAGGHRGVADGIKQRGLAVVHVAHDNHHGSPGDQILRLILVVVDEALFDGDGDLVLHLAAQLHGHQGGGVVVDDLGQGGHDAVLHQHLDHFGAGLLHAGGQLAHGDLIGDGDLQGHLLGDLQLETTHLLLLVLAALVALEAVAAPLVVVAELLLAAPLLHPGSPLGSQLLQTLVILGQVHVAALAGVHHLLLGNPGGGVLQHGRCRLGRGVAAGIFLALLLGRSGALAACGALGLGLGSVGVGGLGAAVAGGSGSALALGLLLLGRLLIGVRKDGLDAGHGMMLGQIIKNEGQLLIAQNLHVVLGRRGVTGQDLRDLLGGKAEILCHLMHSVFFAQI